MSRVSIVCEQCKKEKRVDTNRRICADCRTFNARLSSGEILPPDYPDITYAPYKTPMIENESGYGYLGAIIQTKTGSHVQCNECGYFFRNLSAHLLSKHQISPRDYKIKYGLRVTQGLLSPQMREKMQALYNKNARFTQGIYKNAQLAKEAIRKKREAGEKAYTAEKGTWIPQLRNERGQCAEQLIEKIKELGTKLGRTPQYHEFGKEYGYGAMKSIQTLHKSWNNAVRKSGLPTYSDRRRAAAEENAEQMLDKIQEWYQKNGRTPQYSDFMSEEELPSPRQVTSSFKGLNRARELTGVPKLINKGNGEWVEEES